MIIAIVALLIIVGIYQFVIANHLAWIRGQRIGDIIDEIKHTKSAIVDLRNDLQEIKDQLEDYKNRKT